VRVEKIKLCPVNAVNGREEDSKGGGFVIGRRSSIWMILFSLKLYMNAKIIPIHQYTGHILPAFVRTSHY
jgi:hypothetical protein